MKKIVIILVTFIVMISLAEQSVNSSKEDTQSVEMESESTVDDSDIELRIESANESMSANISAFCNERTAAIYEDLQ